MLDYEPGSCGYTIWPLRRPETMPAHAPALDPLDQSQRPLDAGSFCLPTCERGSTCASAADGGSCGWCEAPTGGATGGRGTSTSTTGPRGALHGGQGLATWGSALGSCFCSCRAWHWQGTGCPAEPTASAPACPGHRTCSSCLGAPSCAWCSTSESCYSRTAQSSQVCGEWHDLTCPMVPQFEAFAPTEAMSEAWDLA